MADYEHRRITTHRHEYGIKNATHGGFGVPVAEIEKAIEAAARLYTDLLGHPPRHDDWLRVWAADDEVILWFEETGSTS